MQQLDRDSRSFAMEIRFPLSAMIDYSVFSFASASGNDHPRGFPYAGRNPRLGNNEREICGAVLRGAFVYPFGWVETFCISAHELEGHGRPSPFFLLASAERSSRILTVLSLSLSLSFFFSSLYSFETLSWFVSSVLAFRRRRLSSDDVERGLCDNCTATGRGEGREEDERNAYMFGSDARR